MFTNTTIFGKKKIYTVRRNWRMWKVVGKLPLWARSCIRSKLSSVFFIGVKFSLFPCNKILTSLDDMRGETYCGLKPCGNSACMSIVNCSFSAGKRYLLIQLGLNICPFQPPTIISPLEDSSNFMSNTFQRSCLSRLHKHSA